MTEKLTPAQAAYRKWYKANKVAYNLQRAEKYASDPTLQEKARKAQQEYRKNTPRKKADGNHFRPLKGKEVQVFRIGAVAEMIGRDEQTIRSWEAKGYIPKPSIKSTHRYYTLHQVNLLIEFGELSSMVRWDPAVRDVAIPNKSAEIKARWVGV